MGQLTLPEAGRRLGLSRWRVWQLVKAGRLPATKAGRDWLVEEADLARVADRPAPGRPRTKG